MNTTQISMQTVRYFKRIMRPIAEDGIIPLPEYHEAISQLTSLAEHGILKPTIVPKLIDQREAAEMLGIGLSNFKKLEGEGAFPFKRKMVGSSVRYRDMGILDLFGLQRRNILSVIMISGRSRFGKLVFSFQFFYHGF